MFCSQTRTGGKARVNHNDYELSPKAGKYILDIVLEEGGLVIVGRVWHRFLICFFYAAAFVLGVCVGTF